MKRVNTEKMFLVCAMVCGLATFAAADVVAYWPFLTNGVNDVSGNNNALTAVGVKFNGGAAVMDGRQSIFSTAANLNLSGYSNVTMECFIKTTAASPAYMLLEITEEACYSGGLMLLLNNGVAGQLDGRYYTSYGKSYKDFTDTANVADGAWHHIAMVADRTQADNNDRVRLYLDGQLQSSNVWNEAGSPVFRNGKLYIGARANGNWQYPHFVGAIDDIRISGAALEPGQFLQERTADPIEAIAYWPFNCGEERNDATGNRNHLASSGVVFSNGVAVLKGNAVTAFNTATNLSLSSYSALTMEYFIKTTSSSDTHMLLEVTESAFNFEGGLMLLLNNAGAGKLQGRYYVKNSNSYKDDSDTANVADGEWHHVAMVVDRTQVADSDRVLLYLDGELQTKSAWDLPGNPVFKDGKLYIGSRANFTGFPKYVGELDDIRITGAALVPGQFLQERTESAPTVIAHWPFNLEGARADASGHGNVLSSTGVAFRHGAAVLDGMQAVFNTASGLLLRPYTMLTVEYFIKTASTNQHFVVESTPDSNYGNVAFNSSINVAYPGRVNSLIHGNLGYGGYGSEAGENVADGEWHHVAMVFDRDASGAAAALLYLDGRLQKPGDTTYGSTGQFQNDRLYIGSRNNGTARPKFVGELDDIRITGVALQPEQFMQARSVETPKVIAYWPFSLGTELEDASGNTNTLQKSSGITFRSRAAVLDGSQTIFNTIKNLELSPYLALTVEYFVKTESKAQHFILEYGPVTFENPGTFYHAINLSSNGQVSCSFKMQSDNCFDKTDWANNVPDGAWHHVAMVYDRYKDGADRVRLYLDRTLQSVSEQNGISLTTLRNEKLYLGSRKNGTTLPKFIGALDDIRITGAALEPDEFIQRRSSELPSELGTLITIH